MTTFGASLITFAAFASWPIAKDVKLNPAAAIEIPKNILRFIQSRANDAPHGGKCESDAEGNGSLIR